MREQVEEGERGKEGGGKVGEEGGGGGEGGGSRKAGHSDSKIRCRAPSSTPVAARGKNYRLIIYRTCLHTIPGTFGGVY